MDIDTELEESLIKMCPVRKAGNGYWESGATENYEIGEKTVRRWWIFNFLLELHSECFQADTKVPGQFTD